MNIHWFVAAGAPTYGETGASPDTFARVRLPDRIHHPYVDPPFDKLIEWKSPSTV